MKCPSCGAEATGRFCSSCGTSLVQKQCPSCSAVVDVGTRFCRQCGADLDSGGGSPGPVPERIPLSGNPSVGWWAAGALLIVTIFSLGYPALKQANDEGGTVPPMPAGMESGGGQSGLVDLTTMPLDEQGTTLFNRVMQSSSVGDTADVAFFLPKALLIHEQLNPTDPDGLYHFALLHQVGGDHEAALVKAREGLQQVPEYLLLLAVAAESSAALGDEETAEELYRRFLEAFDAEMARMRPGYEHHTAIFPVYRAEAAAFLEGR